MHPFSFDAIGTDATSADVTDDERRAQSREAFLGASRSLPACTRELERLAEAVTRRLNAADVAALGAKAEVRRAPGRTIVQLGPVALTISWVRARVDTAAAGRLMIVEWRGTVARGPEQIPERGPVRRSVPAPVAVRETVYAADATSEGDWRWRGEGDGSVALTSSELADECVDSLLAALRAG